MLFHIYGDNGTLNKGKVSHFPKFLLKRKHFKSQSTHETRIKTRGNINVHKTECHKKVVTFFFFFHIQ